MTRLILIATTALAWSCAHTTSRPSAVSPTTSEDQFFAGQLEKAAVSATRELAGAAAGSDSADQALFILDYANSIVPTDVTGEMADFIRLRRSVANASTPQQAFQELERLYQRVTSMRLDRSLRSGLIHLATGMTLMFALPGTDQRVLSQYEAALAALPASAARWRIFAEIQLLYASLANDSIAAQPRTRLRMIRLAESARKLHAPWLEAMLTRMQGDAAIAEYAPEDSPALYASSRKLFLSFGLFDLAADSCAAELRVFARSIDPSLATALSECLGITQKILNPSARVRWEAELLRSTAIAVLGFTSFRQMQTPRETINTTATIELTPLETSLSRQAVEIGARLLRDSTARGETLQQQVFIRMWLALLFSYLGRDAEAVDVLAEVYDQATTNLQVVVQGVDALLAYGNSLERLGRFDDATRALTRLGETICAPSFPSGPGFPDASRGREMYFRAGRASIHAAKLPAAPALPLFASATAETRPILERARTALAAGLACKTTFDSHSLFFLLAADVALGDASAATTHGKQYVKNWHTSAQYVRELPSPLELLPSLLAIAPGDTELATDLAKRRERLAKRKPY